MVAEHSASPSIRGNKMMMDAKMDGSSSAWLAGGWAGG